MKQFTLTLITMDPRVIDRVEADDLVHLLAQFLLVIATVQERLEKPELTDDDIPFQVKLCAENAWRMEL